MSRTDKVVSSPCKKYLQWKNKYDEDERLVGGTFIWYDKEKGENVEVELPFKFAIINPDLKTFKGFNDKRKQGVWSNEVRDPDHEVVIRNKDGVLLKFLFKDYSKKKDEVKGVFAKYTSSVYIGVPVDGEMEIWNLQLTGAAANGGNDPDFMTPEDKNDGWFSFLKRGRSKMYSNWIVVSDVKHKKKGKTKFSIPVFEFADQISKNDADSLDALDLELKEYLTFYFKKPEEAPATASVDDSGYTPDPDDDDYDN